MLLHSNGIKIYIFVIENSCRRPRTSRFEVIGRAKAQKFFGGLVLSYCQLSSAITSIGQPVGLKPRAPREIRIFVPKDRPNST